MFVELCLISICATGFGVFYCFETGQLKRHDVEQCFDKISNKIEIFANKFEKGVTDFVNSLDENSSSISDDEVELGDNLKNEETELLIGQGQNTGSSDGSLSGPEEFIMLYD